MMSVWNFTFGSHLSETQFREVLGGRPSQRVPARLLGHRLTFCALKTYPDDYAHLATGGGPTFAPDPDGVVYGVAYRITQAQFEIVDAYERDWGYVSFACRVESDQGFLQALAHRLAQPGGFAPPGDAFLQLMLDGLAQHGYGAEVVAGIKAAAEGAR